MCMDLHTHKIDKYKHNYYIYIYVCALVFKYISLESGPEFVVCMENDSNST